ncbi:MAG: pyridoxamine 5'-phosphate oxidase family protein, partial [Nitrospirota bacterium]|nr:pyridoxamine 5'-phosphate oxidase family protein [Nitrospirota bacterium]
RERLKILGHARIEDALAHPELTEHVTDLTMRSSVERLVFIDVVSFDWNCPKYITPRYSAEEIEELAGPLRNRIAELETELHSRKS